MIITIVMMISFLLRYHNDCYCKNCYYNKSFYHYTKNIDLDGNQLG